MHCKDELGDPCQKKHPFMPLTKIIQKCIAKDPQFLDIRSAELGNGIAAAGFMESAEYKQHPLVLQTASSGNRVLPIAVCCDGISVGQEPQQDTLYAIYITFPHLGTRACADMDNKHLFTLYKKSQLVNGVTANQVWDVLLWELQALQHGCSPQLSEKGKPLQAQEAGPSIAPNLGYTLHACLMQIRGDWSWICDALGVWQWNSKAHM